MKLGLGLLILVVFLMAVSLLGFVHALSIIRGGDLWAFSEAFTCFVFFLTGVPLLVKEVIAIGKMWAFIRAMKGQKGLL